MYSYEDRLRAVLLYVNQGKRAGITIRQLGYPTKNTLKVWYLAYERSRDFPRVYQRKPKYTAKQRDLAVDHFLSHGRSIAVTIQALGYPSKSLLFVANRSVRFCSTWIVRFGWSAGGRAFRVSSAAGGGTTQRVTRPSYCDL